jgi:hypothetical protein
MNKINKMMTIGYDSHAIPKAINGFSNNFNEEISIR